MKKLIVLSFLVAACAVSLANTEVSALDNTEYYGVARPLHTVK